MPRAHALVVTVLTVMLVVPPAVAVPSDSQLPLLAVLELDAGDKKFESDELLILTDVVRGVVVTEVGDRYKVLTRETMFELVPPDRMTCFVNKCAAEIGRMLQAEYVVSGIVRRLGGKLFLTLEAYESTTGRLIGSAQIKGTTAEALVDETTTRLASLARNWFSHQAKVSPRAATDSSISSPPALTAPPAPEPARISDDGMAPARVARESAPAKDRSTVSLSERRPRTAAPEPEAPPAHTTPPERRPAVGDSPAPTASTTTRGTRRMPWQFDVQLLAGTNSLDTGVGANTRFSYGQLFVLDLSILTLGLGYTWSGVGLGYRYPVGDNAELIPAVRINLLSGPDGARLGLAADLLGRYWFDGFAVTGSMALAPSSSETWLVLGLGTAVHF